MRSRFCSSASTITLPTKWTLSAGTPSQIRLVTALRSVANSRSDDRVGGDAVDLLGHLAVEAAQAGLDVRHRDAELDRGERGGERRVDVAHHQHQVRASAPGARSRCPPSRARSGSRAIPTPTCRKTSGRGSPRSRKKTPESSAVVVLPGMEQERLDRRPAPHLGEQRRQLDEVRAAARHGEDHHLVHERTGSPTGGVPGGLDRGGCGSDGLTREPDACAGAIP